MIKLFTGSLIVASLLVMGGCKTAKSPQSNDSGLPMANLKDFKKNKDGAYVIFDGSSLDGWRGYNRADMPNKWSIEDGSIKFSRQPAGVSNAQGGDIIFAHKFKNFELSFEWKISEA